jgi:hypothetical protein
VAIVANTPEGRPAAAGYSLPSDIAVEIEATVELHDGA